MSEAVKQISLLPRSTSLRDPVEMTELRVVAVFFFVGQFTMGYGYLLFW
jgi:hypothetical protein